MCQAAVEGCSGVKLAVMNCSGQGGGGGEARLNRVGLLLFKWMRLRDITIFSWLDSETPWL